MEGRVNISEEIPDVADDNTHDFVLGHSAMKNQAEAHQEPREVWRGKDEKSKETQPGVRVPTRPNVHKG